MTGFHILTAHHRTDRWVDVQLDAVAATMPGALVHGCLEGVPESVAARFDSVLWMDGDHAPKLNALAGRCDAADDDVLIFLDGDAWPVADVRPTIRRALDEGSAAVAVRRDESGQRGPHPCFTAVTAGWWRASGAMWGGRDLAEIGDTLATVLRGYGWTPLLRLNRANPHPQFFGVYGIDAEPLVYHHGAGFREPFSRLDRRTAWADGVPYRRVVARNARLSEQWYAKAQRPGFWRELV